MLNRRYNNKKPFPLPSDIEKLSKYLKVSLNEFDTHDTSLEKFRLGVTLAEARLVTYNKRRSGEMQAVTIKDFNKRIKGMDNVAEHMAGPITPFEKKLIESQQVLEIRGKTGKAVPVIIPRDALHVLEFISNPVIRDMVVFQQKIHTYSLVRDVKKVWSEHMTLSKPRLQKRVWMNQGELHR